MEAPLAILIVVTLFCLIWVLPIAIIGTNRNLPTIEKVLYLLLVLFFSLLGFLVYLFVAPSRDKK